MGSPFIKISKNKNKNHLKNYLKPNCRIDERAQDWKKRIMWPILNKKTCKKTGVTQTSNTC